MDEKDLLALEPQALADYLRRRLRLEEPLEPPLDRRFRMEPPEDFLIRAVENNPDSGFRDRLIQAMRANIAAVKFSIADMSCGDATRDHVASLGYLATAINAHELGTSLSLLAQGMIESGGDWGDALLQMLLATVELADNSKLIPFWRDLLEDKREDVRGCAYLGLMHADTAQGLEELPRMLHDAEGDLPTLIWSFATDCPGIAALAKGAKNLSAEDRALLRAALTAAGADASLLAPLEEKSNSGFPFRVPQPQQPALACRPPKWRSSEDTWKKAA